MVNKCTKFKISRFTRNEGMNGGCKMQKMGWFVAVMGHSLRVIGNVTIQ